MFHVFDLFGLASRSYDAFRDRMLDRSIPAQVEDAASRPDMTSVEGVTVVMGHGASEPLPGSGATEDANTADGSVFVTPKLD